MESKKERNRRRRVIKEKTFTIQQIRNTFYESHKFENQNKILSNWIKFKENLFLLWSRFTTHLIENQEKKTEGERK